MSLFIAAMLIGGLGLVAMALLGMGTHGAGHAGHGGHGHGHVGHASHHVAHGARGAGGRAAPAAAGSRVAVGGSSAMLHLLATIASPRVILSVVFGFGLTGLLAHTFISTTWAVAIAVVGGIAFEALLISPLWRLLFRFESKPAETLEHSLFSRGEAATNFDKDGNGLVRIEVDGQVVQLLGTLSTEDRTTRARVHAGDELIVEEIDEERQRCRVSAP